MRPPASRRMASGRKCPRGWCGFRVNIQMGAALTTFPLSVRRSAPNHVRNPQAFANFFDARDKLRSADSHEM